MKHIKKQGDNFIGEKYKRTYLSNWIPGWELPASWDEATYEGNLAKYLICF